MNLIEQIKARLDEASPAIWEKERIISRGDYLKRSGSKDNHLYFVEEGCFRAFIQPEEEELTIRFAYQGDFLIALDSFIIGVSSPLYLQALRKSKVLIASKKRYIDYMHSDHTLQKLWQQVMALLIYQQFEREIDLLTPTPQERYLRVFRRSPRVFQEVPAKYIASYLRMTPETLSRIRSTISPNS